MSRMGRPIRVPRIAGRSGGRQPVTVRDVKLLLAKHGPPDQGDRAGPFTMSRQAQDDITATRKPCDGLRRRGQCRDQGPVAAGADVVQVDEPWMQQYPDQARAFGLKALNRALDALPARWRCICARLCGGGARQADGYSFLPSSKTQGQQISIEAAQPRLDLKVLRNLPGKTIIWVIDPPIRRSRRRHRRRRIPGALPHVPPNGSSSHRTAG